MVLGDQTVISSQKLVEIPKAIYIHCTEEPPEGVTASSVELFILLHVPSMVQNLL